MKRAARNKPSAVAQIKLNFILASLLLLKTRSCRRGLICQRSLLLN